MHANSQNDSSLLNKRLLGLAQSYAERACTVIGSNLISVVLFGSVARGEATPNSDIDLLVVARELPRGAFQRRALLDQVREGILPDLNALWDEGIYTDFSDIVKTKGEAQGFHLLYLDLTEEAALLYDRDGFFAGVLEKLRKRLADLGAQRRRLGQIRYWDLKPDLKPGESLDL